MKQRIEELLIDQAIFGLDTEAEAELNALLGETGGDAAENPFMETAALVQLGMAALDPQPDRAMPADLRRKLAADAARRGSDNNN